MKQKVNFYSTTILEAQDFIKYSHDWWEDYKTIRQSHGSRIIKLFVPTEDREN